MVSDVEKEAGFNPTHTSLQRPSIPKNAKSFRTEPSCSQYSILLNAGHGIVNATTVAQQRAAFATLLQGLFTARHTGRSIVVYRLSKIQ